MKNLDSVFAAYIIGWAVFFFYYLSHRCAPTSNLKSSLDAAVGVGTASLRASDIELSKIFFPGTK